MEFQTLDEALDNQALCGACGRPKKELVSVHQLNVPSRYILRRCKEFRCRVHCSRASGCDTQAPLI